MWDEPAPSTRRSIVAPPSTFLESPIDRMDDGRSGIGVSETDGNLIGRPAVA